MTNILTARGRGSRVRDLAFLGLSLVSLVGSRPAPADAASIFSHHHSAGPHISNHDALLLQEFLAGGPALWATSKPRPIPPGVRIANPDGTLRDTPLVSYLTWLRDRDPSMFESVHPQLARLFQTTAAHSQFSNVQPAVPTPAMMPTPASTQQAQQAAQKSALANSQDPAQQIRNAQIASTLSSARPTISAEYLVLRGPLPKISVPPAVPTTVPVPSTEVMPAPVPEPSSILSTLAVFGLAGGWWRLRGRRNAPA